MGAGRRGGDYAAAVVDTLVGVGEFSDLSDPTIASVVRDAVVRQVRQPVVAFECIVDNVALANWRLRPRRDAPERVRLACFRFPPTQTDREREQRVNQALDRLSV